MKPPPIEPGLCPNGMVLITYDSDGIEVERLAIAADDAAGMEQSAIRHAEEAFVGTISASWFFDGDTGQPLVRTVIGRAGRKRNGRHPR